MWDIFEKEVLNSRYLDIKDSRSKIHTSHFKSSNY